MNNKLDLYLAHNLDTRHKVRKMELMIEDKYNINLFNPFYDSVRDDIDKIDRGEITRWELPLKRCRFLVKRDLSNITRRDGILAIIKKPSIGTTLEIGYARQKHKLIFIISEKYVDHPWIRVYADETFRNVTEFEQWLVRRGYEYD